MKKSLLLAVSVTLFLSNSSFASTLFIDNFNSGIDDTYWSREELDGAKWVGTNGVLASQPQYNSDRYLDILTTQSFSDFILTFDMKFNNNGYDQDWRRIYLRANGDTSEHAGYCINIRNWSGGIYDRVRIGPYTDKTLDIEPIAFDSYWSPLVTGEWYTFKAQLDGSNIKIKYWLQSDTEPSDWLFDVTDPNSSYAAGKIGFGNYWYADTYVDNVRVEKVPEPATMVLVGLGSAAFAFFRRRKS